MVLYNKDMNTTSSSSQTQSSIRSFFQPKLPTYSAPPGQAPPNTITPIAPPLPPQNKATPPPPLPSQPLQKILPAPPRPSTDIPSNTHPTLTDTPHPQAKISTITKDHIQPLRRINSLLLPIPYSDNFYHQITSTPPTTPNFSRVILWTDKPTKGALPSNAPQPSVIGGIVCRLDLDPASQTCEIYIQSLALLSPYRGLGLATSLLNEIIRYAIEQKIEPCPITNLYAHVWTDNEEALRWYGAHGFVRDGQVIHGYYRRLQPDSAVLLRRTIKPSDHTLTTKSSTTGGVVEDQKSVSTTSSNRPNGLQTNNRAVSYQQKGPGHEWNDLPLDILLPSSRNASARPSPHGSTTNLTVAGGGAAVAVPGAPSTAVKGKKKRVYPTAAFGGV